jgi:hypothetical protein
MRSQNLRAMLTGVRIGENEHQDDVRDLNTSRSGTKSLVVAVGSSTPDFQTDFKEGGDAYLTTDYGLAARRGPAKRRAACVEP